MPDSPNKTPKHGVIFISDILNQILKILPVTFAAGLLSVSAFGMLMLVSYWTGTPLWQLTRESSEVMDYPPYIGMLSNWGALVWMTTTVICLFTAGALKGTSAPRETRVFILCAGLLSLVITIDDMFRLHDLVLPRLLDIREGFFYLLYLLSMIAFLVFFRRQILQRDYLLLVAAFFFFFMSRQLFIDIGFLDGSSASGDILKYFGNVFWLAFFYRVASQELSGLLTKVKTE